ncbi:MAG: ACT domain-containing protein [Theionarchaea archaeon]|nr:ACT domain-containing protein [Theionarchaea archaeon]MBU7001073.1 ACT domain-containing protein [Theionarchaea archaeon]MBU7020562.1 ACT domain-containing protein [Theionarchaea archaeon]MBU7034171.1 ACT domain-containing protein [Theionarchaea archaeon]MBU7039285.1 ACT domain-containing protein [Theionarchaea archaeon]
MPTTAELTEAYLKTHPSITDCLSYGIINYSKLARKIASELHIEKETSIKAVLVACIRYAKKMERKKPLEKSILAILTKSELEIRNKIVIAITDKRIFTENVMAIAKKIESNADTFYVIEGTKAFTLIFSEKYQNEIQRFLGKNILKVTENRAMITIKSPEAIENTPGVVSYLYSIFAENGININQTMSCWTDTIFVISEEDIAPVMSLLRFHEAVVPGSADHE